MSITRALPARTANAVLGALGAGTLVALLAGAEVAGVTRVAIAASAVVGVAALADYLYSVRAWRLSSPVLRRQLPAAFAIGVKRPGPIAIEAQGARQWHCALYDHADATLVTEGMPVTLDLQGGKSVDVAYTVMPTVRGQVVFAPATVRVRTRWGFWDLLERLGTTERRRVYPDFAQVARYAWLAGDHRLQEIGIKTYQQRGKGTDFKQLSEYQVGASIRHIDWRATLRVDRPIVREFQAERGQRVMLLIDCGRRMRADDRQEAIGTSHFDQVLNAVMLLSYVALKQGDAVGAMTFGTDAQLERSFMPRKGVQALPALMGQLYDLQPTPTYSDYVAAAQRLMRTGRQRSLIVIVTNFRDEDSAELRSALRLLRTRHLVLLASLRERVVGELLTAPLTNGDAAIDVASAHVYEQARRDAFNRLAARDGLMVDAEPERLGVELVNR